MAINGSAWREAQAKWLKRPEYETRRSVLQAIATNPEVLAGYERGQEKLDKLWDDFSRHPRRI